MVDKRRFPFVTVENLERSVLVHLSFKRSTVSGARMNSSHTSECMVLDLSTPDSIFSPFSISFSFSATAFHIRIRRLHSLSVFFTAHQPIFRVYEPMNTHSTEICKRIHTSLVLWNEAWQIRHENRTWESEWTTGSCDKKEEDSKKNRRKNGMSKNALKYNESHFITIFIIIRRSQKKNL